MARIPPIKRLTTEDFKDQTSWIGKLLTPLNDFMSSTVASLNRGLTFTDNFAAQVKTLTFTVDANTYPIKFLCTTAAKPIGLWVVSAREVSSNPSTLTTAVFADWSYSNGQVVINNFSGLTSGLKYDVCVIIVTG
jgi:hypothetical protein